MRIRIGIGFFGRTFFLWFGAFFTAIGLIFVYVGIQDADRERAYQEEGRTVEAVVVDKTIKRASREGNNRTRYEIAYRFAAPDGRAVEGLDQVEVEEWERLAPGSRFKVTYLPGAPETSRAAGSGDATAAHLLASGLIVNTAFTHFLVPGEFARLFDAHRRATSRHRRRSQRVGRISRRRSANFKMCV